MYPINNTPSILLRAVISLSVVVAFSTAYAGDLYVTTTNDTVANDGVLSLREAFIAASDNNVADTIHLQQGKNYTLSACNRNRNASAGNSSYSYSPNSHDGPMVHHDNATLTLEGKGNVQIINNCQDGTQTLLNASLGTNNSILIVKNIELKGAGATIGGAIYSVNGTVKVKNSIIHNSGSGVIGIRAIVIIKKSSIYDTLSAVSNLYGSVRIAHSRIYNNRNGVTLTDTQDVRINTSSITNNDLIGARTTGFSVMSIRNSHIDNNGQAGVVCLICEKLNIIDSTVNNNGNTQVIPEGNREVGGGVFIQVRTKNIKILRSQINNNVNSSTVSSHQGGGISVEGDGSTRSKLRVINSTISGNLARKKGGGIYSDSSNVYIRGSSIYNNNAQNGGGLHLSNSEFYSVNSTISGNHANSSGGGIKALPGTNAKVRLKYTTLANNRAVNGANIYADEGKLEVGRSIIVDPIGGNNCIIFGGASIISRGYTATSDSTCLLSHPTNRRTTGSVLGILADNGGATLTHFPITLDGMIPRARCAASRDQRGRRRPKGSGCEPGAVEIFDFIIIRPHDDFDDIIKDLRDLNPWIGRSRFNTSL